MRFVVMGLAASAAVLGFTSPAQADAGPVVLSPSSPWNVDFAPNKCRLARLFGEGEDRHFLFFEQYTPSSSAGLTVAGPALERFRSRARTSLTFFEGQERLRTEPFTGELEQVGPAVIYSNVNLERGTDFEGDSEDDAEGADDNGGAMAQLDTEFAAQSQYVMLRQGSKWVRFDTGPLAEAFEVLNTCTQDMVRDWGLDVEQHLTATRAPEWLNQRSVVRRIQRTYPVGALNRGEQAIVRMRVIVDEEGKVEQCKIDAATENPLESPACREMQRAEFEPALDANGQPFRSYYTTSITYQIGS